MIKKILEELSDEDTLNLVNSEPVIVNLFLKNLLLRLLPSKICNNCIEVLLGKLKEELHLRAFFLRINVN